MQNYDQYVKSLIKDIEDVKKERDDQTNSIKFNPKCPKRSWQSAPKVKELQKPQEVKHLPSKEEIATDMKKKYRNNWRDPGYINGEFGKLPALKGRVLSEWEYLRAVMPERSYKFVPERRGPYYDSQPREFGDPPKEDLPKPFQNYLKDFELKYDDFKLRPSKYGKIDLDRKLEVLSEKRQKIPFRLVNSVQSNAFGHTKKGAHFWKNFDRTIHSELQLGSFYPKIFTAYLLTLILFIFNETQQIYYTIYSLFMWRNLCVEQITMITMTQQLMNFFEAYKQINLNMLTDSRGRYSINNFSNQSKQDIFMFYVGFGR